MDERYRELERAVSVSGLLGYLNFSDGRPDPRWQKQLNAAYAFFAERDATRPWLDLLEGLKDGLKKLSIGGSSAFRDVRQAEAVLALAARVLPAYRSHHADLLAHLDDRDVYQPFFLVRVFEAILAQGVYAENPEQTITGILRRLNDFVGHRPIAVLETRPQGEPYDHERTRPVPLYLRGTGVGWGRYHDVVVQALDILKATDPALLAEAEFDLDLLDELALDLRAYDHGHPVNRRPNYVFGEWDPHHLDNQGRHRRYVIRKITLEAILDRFGQQESPDPAQQLWEAGAVLAGTILMAAGVSGASPTAHDSATTLANLLPRIARYRDAFYDFWLKKLSGPHAAHLRQERETTRQPFGAARQYLNAYLARHRAAQLQQRYLALIYAEMGYPEASRTEAGRIPAVSVRLLSDILCRLTSGQVEVDRGDLRGAAQRLPEVEDLLHRGIACGAFADPWNILGFQGLFPLSPAREDSLRDPRLDELVQVVELTFNLYARVMSEASATGAADLVPQLSLGLKRLAEWWDPFATSAVSDVRHVHGGEAASSANHVAEALARWHERGEAAGDLAFWRGHLENFHSPKSFALVVDALLRKADYRAALALLASWLGKVEEVPLEDGVYSFHTLALRWMLALTRPTDDRGSSAFIRLIPASAEPTATPTSLSHRRALVVKFFDYLEANAEDYWRVPALEVFEIDEEEEDEEEEDDLYGAAYDDVTFEDSTDDEEGDVVGDGEPEEEFDLEHEGELLDKRMRFLSTVARLWQIAARFLANGGDKAGRSESLSSVAAWLDTARGNLDRLTTLLDVIHEFPLPEPSGEYDSLVEYDRRRVLKEQLLNSTIGTCLDTTLAVGALRGAVTSANDPPSSLVPPSTSQEDAWAPHAIRLERALFSGEADTARAALGSFVEQFQNEPLLFTPLTEGGSPRQILRVRVAQTVLRALLANLPRLGLVRETFDLLRIARAMEQAQPTRGRGVTEFNHFFQAAYQAVVESVVESSSTWDAEHGTNAPLVDLLERLTAPFLALWIEHSRTLQLSVLETLSGDAEWQALQAFVQKYGSELFHARFLTLANLRGVLHRGLGPYLDYLAENPDPMHPMKLLDDLGRTVPREDAVRRLEVVVQAVVENYEEYKDYNTTTTQSDYGENLHVLLDFLRLKVGYERHAWQFRPLVLAHEVLARRGRNEAAVLWEQKFNQFTRELARQHAEHLTKMERTRGVRLGTVADRIAERFVKPLALDRLCALVEPAMMEARQTGGGPAFPRFQEEAKSYTATPTGVGLDVPYWLRRLEMEVRRVQATHTTIAMLAENFFRVPRRPLAYDDLQRQLREWERPALPPT